MSSLVWWNESPRCVPRRPFTLQAYFLSVVVENSLWGCGAGASNNSNNVLFLAIATIVTSGCLSGPSVSCVQSIFFKTSSCCSYWAVTLYIVSNLTAAFLTNELVMRSRFVDAALVVLLCSSNDRLGPAEKNVSGNDEKDLRIGNKPNNDLASDRESNATICCRNRRN
jgi:hypothetical protein